ncbi:hypothetical protein K6Y74_38885, partial [Burkholderia cenocepacia]|nr:hypothetical protein [Burkholderia cenocepacia]
GKLGCLLVHGSILSRIRASTKFGAVHQLEETVRRNAFDEANAEMLMALPVPERPKTSHAAFDWILATLAEIGLTAELGFAERDGYDCGTDALLVLHRVAGRRKGAGDGRRNGASRTGGKTR